METGGRKGWGDQGARRSEEIGLWHAARCVRITAYTCDSMAPCSVASSLVASERICKHNLYTITRIGKRPNGRAQVDLLAIDPSALSTSHITCLFVKAQALDCIANAENGSPVSGKLQLQGQAEVLRDLHRDLPHGSTRVAGPGGVDDFPREVLDFASRFITHTQLV